MPARGSSDAGGSAISAGPDKGEGGGRDVIDPRMLGGVDIGLDGGEAWRRRFVRSEAKKAGYLNERGQLWSFGFAYSRSVA